MRKGLFIVGVILLLVGVLSVAYPMVIGTSGTIPALPNQASPVPPILGSGSYTVSWSGGTSDTHIVLYECPTSACSDLPTASDTLANVSGASGSFTVTLSAGNSYGMFEYGTPISVSATATDRGITLLVLIGIILVIVGAIVTLLGVLARARSAEEVEAPAMPAEPAPAAPVAAPAAVADAGTVQEAAPAAAPPAAGARAPRKCGHCGTMNEPWITNCRKCKRPLASTGQ